MGRTLGHEATTFSRQFGTSHIVKCWAMCVHECFMLQIFAFVTVERSGEGQRLKMELSFHTLCQIDMFVDCVDYLCIFLIVLYLCSFINIVFITLLAP